MEPIYVWPFRDAPKNYRELSRKGGDEDWVVFVPDRYKGMWLPWLSRIDTCEDPEEHTVDGGTVYIGSHA